MKIETSLSPDKFRAAFKKIMEVGVFQAFKCDCGHTCNSYYRDSENKLKRIENCPACNVKLISIPFMDVLKKMFDKMQHEPIPKLEFHTENW